MPVLTATPADDRQVNSVDDEDKPPDTGLEDVQKELGGLGRYQVFQLVAHSFCYTSYAFIYLGFAFTGYEPERTCRPVDETQLLEKYNLSYDDTATVTYSSCNIKITSNKTGVEKSIASLGCFGGYEHEGGRMVSVVTEWDLVCDRSGLAELMPSMLSLGGAVGIFLWSSVSDRFGRKYVFMFITFAVTMTELGLLFSTSIFVAITCRFFSGFFGCSMVLIHFVKAEELFISNHRQLYGGWDSVWWSLCVIFMTGCSFFMRSYGWRDVQILTTTLCALVFVLSFFVNETPAWYFAKGRYDDARRILNKALTMNGKDTTKGCRLYHESVLNEQRKRLQVEHDATSDTEVSETNYSILDILHHPKLLVMTAVVSFAWLTTSFTYYSLFLTSSTLAGDHYLNFFLTAAVDFPGYLIYIILLVYFGRRSVLSAFYAQTVIALLVLTCLIATASKSSHKYNSSTAFFLLGKFGITVSYNILYAYTPEIFPTPMRSMAVGICIFCSLIGNVLAPFLIELHRVTPWGPSAVNAVACAACVILLRLVPETRGRQLPNTIEDVLKWRSTSLRNEVNRRNSLKV